MLSHRSHPCAAAAGDGTVVSRESVEAVASCNRFSIQGIPHFFLLDPEGNTVLQGHHNLDQFDAYLQQHL